MEQLRRKQSNERWAMEERHSIERMDVNFDTPEYDELRNRQIAELDDMANRHEEERFQCQEEERLASLEPRTEHGVCEDCGNPHVFGRIENQRLCLPCVENTQNPAVSERSRNNRPTQWTTQDVVFDGSDSDLQLFRQQMREQDERERFQLRVRRLEAVERDSARAILYYGDDMIASVSTDDQLQARVSELEITELDPPRVISLEEVGQNEPSVNNMMVHLRSDVQVEYPDCSECGLRGAGTGFVAARFMCDACQVHHFDDFEDAPEEDDEQETDTSASGRVWSINWRMHRWILEQGETNDAYDSPVSPDTSGTEDEMEEVPALTTVTFVPQAQVVTRKPYDYAFFSYTWKIIKKHFQNIDIVIYDTERRFLVELHNIVRDRTNYLYGVSHLQRRTLHRITGQELVIETWHNPFYIDEDYEKTRFEILLSKCEDADDLEFDEILRELIQLHEQQRLGNLEGHCTCVEYDAFRMFYCGMCSFKMINGHLGPHNVYNRPTELVRMIEVHREVQESIIADTEMTLPPEEFDLYNMANGLDDHHHEIDFGQEYRWAPVASSEVCSICQHNIVTHTCPGNHGMCRDCIDNWGVTGSGTCPVCRRRMRM